MNRRNEILLTKTREMREAFEQQRGSTFVADLIVDYADLLVRFEAVSDRFAAHLEKHQELW